MQQQGIKVSKYTEQVLVKFTKEQMKQLEAARKQHNQQQAIKRDWNGEIDSMPAFIRYLCGMKLEAENK